jgi:gliding motility-associated-like protein
LRLQFFFVFFPFVSRAGTYNSKKIMMRYLCFIVILLVSYSGWSQTLSLFNNNGADVYMMPGSYMIVNNDSLFNHQGMIQNAGDLRVAGNIFNTDTLAGGPGSNTGLYDIGGNWVNSGTVISYQDSVLLNGDATGSSGASGDQFITGMSVTPFYDLILAGTAGSVKTQTIDATVSGILDLRTSELATQANTMTVLNTSPTAITQANASTGSGYVSSLSVGMLARATNATSAYFYPTGIPSAIVSGTDPYYYRPIDMTPSSNSPNTYGVRLADNPTADSFNVADFDDSLCSVNPHYYHRLYHSQGGDPVAITMYFDPAADGAWTDMAHWGAPLGGKWNYMGPPTTGTGYSFSSLQINDWSNFNPFPFALASKKFDVDAGQDQQVYAGQTVTLDGTTTAINIDSIQWTPDIFLSSSTILDPTSVPTHTTQYYLTVVNNLGCRVKDSVTITILPSLLLIPTAFSPNNDGVNDLFRPLNKNLARIDFQIYDRWGQKVYETDVIGDGWDGTFRNAKQDIGVYVWQAQYQLTGSTQTLSESGNVTLVR